MPVVVHWCRRERCPEEEARGERKRDRGEGKEEKGGEGRGGEERGNFSGKREESIGGAFLLLIDKAIDE